MKHPLGRIFPEHVLARLDIVEERLLKEAQSRERLLGEWTLKTIEGGGKRVRPLLLLTAYEACRGDEAHIQAALDAAVALELVHTASLVHDDIMDEASERRGRPSIYAEHGRDGALLVGDYLFTQAFAIASRLPKAVMELTADACRRLCEGQLREQRLQRSGKPDRDAYVAVIHDKTASLLSAACAIGGVLAGAPQTQIDALYRYGESIGQAFQVLDDVLDVAGDPEWTGKPAGTDYLEGTWTSPYLHFLQRGGVLPDERSPDAFPEVRARLFETGSVAASQLEASGYTQAALLELDHLPATPARESLSALATLLMERVQ